MNCNKFHLSEASDFKNGVHKLLYLSGLIIQVITADFAGKDVM